MSKQQEAQRLLVPEKAVFLVTIGEDGRPDTRAMAVVETEGLKTIWMMTGKSSDKYRQLLKNPNCMLYATEMEDDANYLELRLWGRMELLDDAASRARAWRDQYLHYFPAGQGDPGLVVLKFTADTGVLQTLGGKEKVSF